MKIRTEEIPDGVDKGIAMIRDGMREYSAALVAAAAEIARLTRERDDARDMVTEARDIIGKWKAAHDSGVIRYSGALTTTPGRAEGYAALVVASDAWLAKPDAGERDDKPLDKPDE